MGSSSQTWSTIAAFLLGYTLNIFRDELRHRRKRQLIRDSREFKQRMRDLARQKAFRRKAVADLEQLVAKYYRSIYVAPEDSEFEADWLDDRSEERVRMVNLASVLGDPEIVEMVERFRTQTTCVMEWNGGQQSHPDREKFDKEYDYESIEQDYQKLTNRLVQIQRDLV